MEKNYRVVGQAIKIVQRDVLATAFGVGSR